jgi:hypothetical protein
MRCMTCTKVRSMLNSFICSSPYFRLPLSMVICNPYTANVELLHGMGQGSAKGGWWNHSCSSFCQCLYIPHLLPEILVAGGLCMDHSGCRKWSPDSNLCIIAYVGPNRSNRSILSNCWCIWLCISILCPLSYFLCMHSIGHRFVLYIIASFGWSS